MANTKRSGVGMRKFFDKTPFLGTYILLEGRSPTTFQRF
jgi:hypothetical protein